MCNNYLKNTISCAKTKYVLDSMLIPTMKPLNAESKDAAEETKQ